MQIAQSKASWLKVANNRVEMQVALSRMLSQRHFLLSNGQR